MLSRRRTSIALSIGQLAAAYVLSPDQFDSAEPKAVKTQGSGDEGHPWALLVGLDWERLADVRPARWCTALSSIQRCTTG